MQAPEDPDMGTPRMITIHVELRVVVLQEQDDVLPGLGDALAATLAKWVGDTPGMAHLSTAEWDLSIQ